MDSPTFSRYGFKLLGEFSPQNGACRGMFRGADLDTQLCVGNLRIIHIISLYVKIAVSTPITSPKTVRSVPIGKIPPKEDIYPLALSIALCMFSGKTTSPRYLNG